MSGKGSIKMAGIEEFGKNIYFRGIHKLRLQEEGVGGQKKTNFVNVVCERPLSEKVFHLLHKIVTKKRCYKTVSTDRNTKG